MIESQKQPEPIFQISVRGTVQTERNPSPPVETEKPSCVWEWSRESKRRFLRKD